MNVLIFQYLILIKDKFLRINLNLSKLVLKFEKIGFTTSLNDQN